MKDEEGRAGLHSPHVRPYRYEYCVTLLLMLAYTLNSADRTLIAIIGQPLKVDLELSDTDFGLLAGTAFAALYAFSGVPIARLAERFSRVNILFVVMVLWSGLTAACAAATSFAQLLLLRMGVGVAEAGCTPPAHSLIADYFAPRQRATAISIYSCGISLGYILSAMVGGYVAFRWGWRAACVVVGLPGVAVAVLVKLVIREPVRSRSPPTTLVHGDGTAGTRGRWASNPDASISTQDAAALNQLEARHAGSVFVHELGALASVMRILLLRWPIANFFVGVTVASFASQGAWAFIPAYFNRVFALDYATVGLVTGLTGGAAVGFGLLAGGFAADYLGKRSASWYALVPAIGLAVSTPLYVLAFLQPDWRATAMLLGTAGFFQYLSFGPTFGVVQNVVEADQRATVTALIYVVLNVVALGGGPLFTGWLIDRFADVNFHRAIGSTVAGTIDALRHPVADSAAFNSACPGGQGASTSTQAAQQLCRSTLALSSRQGIIVTVLLYAWAALHYALGGIGLEAELRASRLRH